MPPYRPHSIESRDVQSQKRWIQTRDRKPDRRDRGGSGGRDFGGIIRVGPGFDGDFDEEIPDGLFDTDDEGDDVVDGGNGGSSSLVNIPTSSLFSISPSESIPSISLSFPAAPSRTEIEVPVRTDAEELPPVSNESQLPEIPTTTGWGPSAGPAPGPTLTHLDPESTSEASPSDPASTEEPPAQSTDTEFFSTTRGWSPSAGPAPPPITTHDDITSTTEPTPTADESSISEPTSDPGVTETSSSRTWNPSAGPAPPPITTHDDVTSIPEPTPTDGEVSITSVPEPGATDEPSTSTSGWSPSAGPAPPPITTHSDNPLPGQTSSGGDSSTWRPSAGPAPSPTFTYVDTTDIPGPTDSFSLGQPTNTPTGRWTPSAGPAPGPTVTPGESSTLRPTPTRSPVDGGDDDDDDGNGNGGGNNGGGGNGGGSGGGNGGSDDDDEDDNSGGGGNGSRPGGGGSGGDGGFDGIDRDGGGLAPPTQVVKQPNSSKTSITKPDDTEDESTWTSDGILPQKNKPASGDGSAEGPSNPGRTYTSGDPLNSGLAPGGNVNYTGKPSTLDGPQAGKKGPNMAVIGGAAAAGVILCFIIGFIFWRRHKTRQRRRRDLNPLLNTEAGGSGMFSPTSNRSQMSMVSNGSMFYGGGYMSGTRATSRQSDRSGPDSDASSQTTKRGSMLMEEKKAAGTPFDDDNYVADGMREHGNTGVTLVSGGPLGYVGIREEDGVADGFQVCNDFPMAIFNNANHFSVLTSHAYTAASRLCQSIQLPAWFIVGCTPIIRILKPLLLFHVILEPRL